MRPSCPDAWPAPGAFGGRLEQVGQLNGAVPAAEHPQLDAVDIDGGRTAPAPEQLQQSEVQPDVRGLQPRVGRRPRRADFEVDQVTPAEHPDREAPEPPPDVRLLRASSSETIRRRAQPVGATSTTTSQSTRGSDARPQRIGALRRHWRVDMGILPPSSLEAASVLSWLCRAERTITRLRKVDKNNLINKAIPR